MILLELLRNIGPINIRFFSSIKGLNKNILVNVGGEILESHISYSSVTTDIITSKLPNNFSDYFLTIRLRTGFVMIDKDWEYVVYTESFLMENIIFLASTN